VGIEAATVLTRKGERIVVVAVRPDLLRDEGRRNGALETLRSLFPGHLIVLAASTSEGPQFLSDTPEVVEVVRRRGFAALSWRRYAFA
jgi:hypothetical protein